MGKRALSDFQIARTVKASLRLTGGCDKAVHFAGAGFPLVNYHADTQPVAMKCDLRQELRYVLEGRERKRIHRLGFVALAQFIGYEGLPPRIS
jgi:hypothetical protein